MLSHTSLFIIWNDGWDLNPRVYSFADCCIGPLCHRHTNLAGPAGIEPTTFRSKRNVISVSPRTDWLVEDNGFEPFAPGCKPGVLAKYTNPPKYGGSGRIRTYNVSYVADLQSVAFNQFSTHFHNTLFPMCVLKQTVCFGRPQRLRNLF